MKRQIKQLNLMCYKLEVVLSVDAWHFLYGTTEGTPNLFYFLSLLSKMVTSTTTIKKRGQEYEIKPGQVDGSILALSKEWGIGRKAATRLLDDFSEHGILTVVSNRLTSVISMVCVSGWMINANNIANPIFSTTVGRFEGVRIHLYNGHKFETLRKTSPRKTNTSKPVIIDKEGDMENEANSKNDDKATDALEPIGAPIPVVVNKASTSNDGATEETVSKAETREK